MSARPEAQAPASPLPLLVAVAVACCPLVLVAWGAGSLALARGARRWHLAAAAVVSAVPLLVWPPGAIARQAAVETAGMVAGVPTLRGSTAVLGALLALLGRLALRTAPLGVPAGLAVAAAQSPTAGDLGAELDPARRRQLERAERRDRRRARDLATRAATSSHDVTRLAPLAVSISGDLPPWWRAGRYVVLPERAARLPRLVIGQPGAGKSTYLAREAFLAGLAGRQLVVIDGKGERSFAAAVLDAYTAGRPDTSVHLFPDEPLSCWQGGPAAQLNRLIGIWPWTAEADWYRELAVLALRLALGAPNQPVTSTGELVRRLDPATLGRLWQGHPAEAGLVKSLAPRLADVAVRVGNLAAALGGLLDGERAIGEADLTIVSLPTMAAESDCEAVLRVLMGDAQHWAAVRKPRQQPALLMVDEFSAISGGRAAAINLLERGRSAGVPVVLAAQSYASLGDLEERDRLVSAAATLVLFASATPDELAKLAGSVQTAEAVLAYDRGSWTGRASVTTRARHRVDANTVRQLATGQAVLVAGGRAEHVQVVQAPGSRAAPVSRPVLPGPPRWGRPALLQRARR